jgi:AcrR family transcriptional regulator
VGEGHQVLRGLHAAGNEDHTRPVVEDGDMDPALWPIWMRPERRAHGPRPTRSRADIAAAAIRVADVEGIEAASLRRVARELGSGTTSLYRYIASKEQLFDLMIDSVLGERQPPASTGDWRSDLRAIAHEHRATALRHPWLSLVPTTRPALGPNGLAWLEATYATVRSLRLDPDDTLARVGTLLTFVRGHVADELAEREAERRSGLGRAAWMEAQERYGEMIFNSGRYPSLSRLMLHAESPHDDDRFDRMFRDGVEHILAGIARGLPSG